MVRWEEAFRRVQDAHFELNGEWLPHGNGISAEQSLSALALGAHRHPRFLQRSRLTQIYRRFDRLN